MKGELTSFFFSDLLLSTSPQTTGFPFLQTANGGAIHRSKFLRTNAATAAVQHGLGQRAHLAPHARRRLATVLTALRLQQQSS